MARKKGLIYHKKKDLTKVEKEVLNLITEDFLNPKQIAKQRDCSLQAVYKIIKRLKKKGVRLQEKKQSKDSFIDSEEYIIFTTLFFNKFCYFCDYHGKIVQLHHIKSKKEGGFDEKENLLPLCPNCHNLIHREKFILGYWEGYYYLTNDENRKILIPSIRQKGILRNFILCSETKMLKLPKIFNAFGNVVKG